jgi:hypothetical protein
MMRAHVNGCVGRAKAPVTRAAGYEPHYQKKSRHSRKIFELERGNRRLSSRRMRAIRMMGRWEEGRAIEENETNLLELLDGSLVDTTALVDQVTGLSKHVSKNDD